MKGIQYLTDNTGNKTALLIDLQKHDKFLNEVIEDLLDVIECENRKDEPTIPFGDAMKNLYRKGKISKKVFQQVTEG